MSIVSMSGGPPRQRRWPVRMFAALTATLAVPMAAMTLPAAAGAAESTVSPTYTAYVPPAPASTALPTISGTATLGQALTATTGSWDYFPTSYTYQWQSCDSTGANCTNIAAANGSSYTLTAAEVGHTMRVVVTAISENGSASASSASSRVVNGLENVTTVVPGKPRITLHLLHDAKGHASLTGTVSPSQAGGKLIIQVRTATGWRKVGVARLRPSTRTASRYAFNVTRLKSGVYRAYFRGDSQYRSGGSRTVTVR